MRAVVFIDETRSDRSRKVAIGCIGSATIAAVGGFLAGAAIADPTAPPLARLLVGGVFGLGFLLIFGAIAVALARRLLRGSVRVVIDTDGVRIAERSVPWSEVRRVVVSIASKESAAMSLAVRRFWWIHVPGEVRGDVGRFIDDLEDFLDSNGVDVPVVVRLFVR